MIVHLSIAPMSSSLENALDDESLNPSYTWNLGKINRLKTYTFNMTFMKGLITVDKPLNYSVS